MESFVSDYRNVLTNKYAMFDGRSSLKEFWMFTLVSIIASIVVAIVGGIIHMKFLSQLYSLAVLVPSIAVGIRRLHDTNKSGWFVLIGLIPVLGWIVLIVLFAQKGDAGANQYGPAPIATAHTDSSAAPTASAPAADANTSTSNTEVK